MLRACFRPKLSLFGFLGVLRTLAYFLLLASTYVHTYVRTYERTYARTYVRTYVRTYIRTMHRAPHPTIDLIRKADLDDLRASEDSYEQVHALKLTSCPNICIKANGRFPVKLGSDRRETLPERVSNDFGRLNFRRQICFSAKISDRTFRFLSIWRGF